MDAPPRPPGHSVQRSPRVSWALTSQGHGSTPLTLAAPPGWGSLPGFRGPPLPRSLDFLQMVLLGLFLGLFLGRLEFLCCPHFPCSQAPGDLPPLWGLWSPIHPQLLELQTQPAAAGGHCHPDVQQGPDPAWLAPDHRPALGDPRPPRLPAPARWGAPPSSCLRFIRQPVLQQFHLRRCLRRPLPACTPTAFP